MEFNNLLKQADYSLVLPRTNIKPLDLIVRKDKSFFEWLTFKTPEGTLMNASLNDMFKSKKRSKYPVIKEGKMSGKLNGSDIIDAKSNFIANIFSLVKSKSKVEIKDKALFKFSETIEQYSNLVQIDEYLNFADLNTASSYAEEVKKGNVYIIFSLLQSSDLSIQSAHDFNWEGELTAEKIEKYLSDLKVNASLQKKEKYIIENSDNNLLVFALKTAKILFKNEMFKLTETKINVRSSGKIEGIELFNDNEIILT